MRAAIRTAGRIVLVTGAVLLALEAGFYLVDGLPHLLDPGAHPGGYLSRPAFYLGATDFPPEVTVLSLLGDASLLAVCAVAVILCWKLPDDQAAQTLALTLTLGVALTSDFWQTVVIYEELTDLPFAFWHAILSLPGWFALAAFLRFSAVFPELLVPGDLPTPARAGPVQGAIAWMRRSALRPAVPWLLATTLWAAPFVTYYALPKQYAGVFFPYLHYLLPGVLLFVLLGVTNFRTGYGQAPEADQRKVLWLVAGLAVTAALLVVPSGLFFVEGVIDLLGGNLLPASEFLVPSFVYPFCFILAALVLLTSLLFAIFYRGALSPKLVIRTSAVYGLLTTSLLVVFSVGEAGVSALLQERLAAANSVATVFSGGVVALLFKPAEGFLQQRIEAALPDELTEPEAPEAARPPGEQAAGEA